MATVRRRFWCSIRLTLFVALWMAPASSWATPLNALQGTTDSIGPLTFEFVFVSGNGGLDLSQVDLALVDAGGGVYGFDVTAPAGVFRVETGEPAKDLNLMFNLTSTVAFGEVSNALVNPAVAGIGAAVTAFEEIAEVAVDVGVFSLGSGDNLLFKSQDISGEGLTSLTISKNVMVSIAGVGSAELVSLQQRYTVIPEPASASLLVLGLTGLALARRSNRLPG